MERALMTGDLWAVCATNALELGVDVGSLDVTLHLGFPGTVASLWQQVLAASAIASDIHLSCCIGQCAVSGVYGSAPSGNR